MRTVAGILFFETIPIIMKILWEACPIGYFLTMSKLNVVIGKSFNGTPSTSTWVALITKVSFLSLYVY